MDEFYNHVAAKTDLESLTKARNANSTSKFYQLCNWDDAMVSKCKALTTASSRRTMCVVPNKETGEPEEAVFALQGFLTEVDLPPLKIRPRPGQLKHIRQHITLTGLGQKEFDEAVGNLYGIHTMLARQVPPGALESWHPSEYNGQSALDIQNRYFTPRKFANGQPKFPFDKLSDDNSYLEDSTTPELYHTYDNHVDYYGAAEAGAAAVAPSCFRPGDIVEVCLSAVMAPVSADKYKMLVVLRSLAAVNTSHTMSAETNRELASARSVPLSLNKVPKRRRAYSPTEKDSGSGVVGTGSAAKRGRMTDGMTDQHQQNTTENPMEAVE
ncbi:hypothetical protein BJ138DRAFT_1117933 [Hygrophoropsis aurantiaca]|uniref:Uncharacterized protein n=1 Tax=Hygrophoropsis aurantiaca TaxID=72124 RepID=A0ACB7ZZ36_9AGAM|nr:hypothetical protein BJ138DRAFT_1117933 [Hygrophoropsis aurantiaca]